MSITRKGICLELKGKSPTAANAVTAKEGLSDASKRAKLKVKRIIGEILEGQ